MKDYSKQFGKQYPVTYMFTAIPGLDKTMTVSDAKLYAQKEYPSDKVFLDLVTQSIAILPESIPPVEFIKNYLKYINDISHHKAVQPMLYDAGYIPYILTPNFSFTENKVPEQLLAILRGAATKAEVTEKRIKCKYFEDSASHNMSWITREEAARIINARAGADMIDVKNTSIVDSISTLDVYNTIFL